jgi:hypothetical protein
MPWLCLQPYTPEMHRLEHCTVSPPYSQHHAVRSLPAATMQMTNKPFLATLNAMPKANMLRGLVLDHLRKQKAARDAAQQVTRRSGWGRPSDALLNLMDGQCASLLLSSNLGCPSKSLVVTLVDHRWLQPAKLNIHSSAGLSAGNAGVNTTLSSIAYKGQGLQSEVLRSRQQTACGSKWCTISTVTPCGS